MEMRPDETTCDKRINLNDALCICSPTILALLPAVTSKRDHTPIAAMVSSIITASVTGKPTSLQIALELTAHDKNLIKTFHNFGV